MTNYARTGRIRAWLAAHPMAADTLLAAAAYMIMIMVMQNNTGAPGLLFGSGSWHADFAWTFLLTAPVAFRRSHPKAAALAFAATSFVQLIAGPAMVTGDLLALLMLYSALMYGDAADTWRYETLALALGTFAGIAIALAPNAGPLMQALGHETERQYSQACGTLYTAGLSGDCAQKLLVEGAISIGVAWMLLISITIIAFWNRARRATVLLMQERNAALESSEAEERRIAAVAERARIARDMHDVVAHTLSIIIIQSDGGRYAGAHDPAVARSTMETIRHESERALNDMKRLLGVFGGSAHAGYGDLAALIAAADAALDMASNGSVIRRSIGRPQPERLGEQAGVAAYRLVQEALTNARKYAGPGVNVAVIERWMDAGLHLTVDDDGQGAAAALDGHKPGYGLIGMNERIMAVGGTVSAGPRDGGGYEVSAWIPFAQSSPDGQTVQGSETAADGVSPSGRPAAARVQDAMAALRSRPFWDVSEESPYEGSNFVERLSHWTERHYLLMDAAAALAMCAFCLWSGISGANVLGSWVSPSESLFITATMTLPLALRRRLPVACATAMAMFAVFQLVALMPITPANALALVALYSAIVYGREDSRRWIILMALADSLLCGLKLAVNTYGVSRMIWLLTDAFSGAAYGLAYATGIETAGDVVRILVIGAGYGMVVAIMCMGAIALGLWTRSRGSNALVLQMREDALRAERDKQKVLAANMERDRISAAIQTEVTETLNGVIDRASAGIAMLDEAEQAGAHPSPEAISDAFAAIGKQGRTALAHMRQLLGVLRETGSTDEAHKGGIDAMKLTPNASLDEQLSRRAPRPQTTSPSGVSPMTYAPPAGYSGTHE